MNLFVLSGHGSESFAAFLNGMIFNFFKRGSNHCISFDNFGLVRCQFSFKFLSKKMII